MEDRRSLKSKGSVPGHFAPLKIEWFKAELEAQDALFRDNHIPF